MVILGIETSCDETAIAVIEMSDSRAKPRVKVLSNIISSQAKLHAKFGGVVPHLAKREHQKNLVPILLQALRESQPLESRNKKHESRGRSGREIQDSKFMILDSILEREPDLFARIVPKVLPLQPPDIDAIAVTVGPGLAPALWVGINFARALAYLWKKPLIPVNHLEGHILTNLLQEVGGRKDQEARMKNFKQLTAYPLSPITFPALCLIVSGGHTELVLMSGYGRYRIIGETLDDAAGEAFDKVAKMMRLGFPGGPIISRLAERGNSAAFEFPRPMIRSENFNFSFSGLKTAVLYTIRDLKKINQEKIKDIAASFEQAVVDVLVAKTVRAARQYKAKTVMIGGGVAANKKLRAELGKALAAKYPSARYLVPRISLTGDNALMIALAGYFRRGKKTTWKNLQADANLRLDTP